MKTANLIKVIPVFVSLYLYFIPKVLVKKYLKRFIFEKFKNYAKVSSEDTFFREIIFRIVSFTSFLSTFGSVIILVLCDSIIQGKLEFRIFGILFTLISIALCIKYIADSLEVSKSIIFIERFTLFFMLGLIIYTFVLS
jgi:hypothetical protein